MDESFVVNGEAWVPAVSYADPDSLLTGSLSSPLASFLTADGALRLVESAERLISWATAVKMQGWARVEEAIGEEPPPRNQEQPERFRGDEVHALAVTEVATTCALAEGTAARQLNDAADLCTSQWPVLEALESGELSSAHARIVLELARPLPADVAENFAMIAVRRVHTRQGRRRTPSEFRTCLRRLQENLHPESLASRKAAAHRERGVWFAPEPDGMCTLSAYIPAEYGLAIYNGLDNDARAANAQLARARAEGLLDEHESQAAGDSRTLPEFRADALVRRLLGSSDGVQAGAFKPEVVVTIPVGIVFDGVSDAGVEVVAAGEPLAELEGYGPIDAPTARRLAAMAPNWQRLFTEYATGRALGMGRTVYRPPKSLLRFLRSRDGTCRFPGCTRRAAACEPDHTVEWHDGGTTDAGNLAMLCRRHHALKSIGAWTYKHSSRTGELSWQSPASRRYVTGPVEFETEAVELAARPRGAPRPEPPPF